MNKTHLTPPRGLIVSCQAAEGEPLYGLNLMRYMARAAVEGGAVAIRALAEEIPSIREEVSVPVIGLVKRVYKDSEVYITPTCREIDEVIASGADVIAMDVTGRARPNGVTTRELVNYARSRDSAILLMADCDTLENALKADTLGFDFIGTTMRGYTPATAGIEIPDYGFLNTLSRRLKHGKLIAEGGIWERGQLARVLEAKPYAVVIGSAITRPKNITRRMNELFGEL
jgi:N-acylglucosamine-6-phosphate 2-epimerase